MGFDSDCVLNIQTVAGEYFCPVCRSLIYPNEALQSQCTHLYCKPCLAYVVSTTRACPYDGYLVTEADSKPLIESNKALADTINKLMVHCLYHRSGCTWQGPLSDSTSHCSGCSFGNSAVVCNRCGIQIVHRQVQEHAQNCPTQAHGESTQEAVATGTAAASDHTQAATHVGTSVTQAQPSQIMASRVQGQDPNQQSNLSTQSQSSIQAAAVPTAEQWYQQQQLYYQQYGYDPYQQQYQQYYPYQQPVATQHHHSQAYMQPVAAQPQPQVQSQVLLQTQLQSHLPSQQPGTQLQSLPQIHSQQQNLSLTQPQPQIQSHTHTPPLGQQNLQAPMQPQNHPVQPHTQVHMPPYQQPQSQMQQQALVHTQNPTSQQPVQPPPQSFTPQSNQLVNPHLQPPPQPPQPPQPQPQPQLQLQPQSQLQLQHSSTHAVTGHQYYPQFQSHQQMQPGGPHMNPQGGIQQHSMQMQNQFLQQVPPLRPPQPPSHHQYVQQPQQPFPGQAPGPVQSHAHQHLHAQSQLRPLGLSQSFQQPSHAFPHPYQNVASPHGMQPLQTQNLGGRPTASANGVLIQPHPYSSVGVQGKPMQVGTGQQSGNAVMTNNPMILSSEQHSGVTSRPLPERGLEAEASLDNGKRNPKDLNVAPGLDADASEVKKIITESEINPLTDENKPIDEAKDTSKSPAAESGEHLVRKFKDDPANGNNDQKNVSVDDNKQVKLSVLEDKEPQGASIEDQSMKFLKGRKLTQSTGEYSLYADQTKQQPPSIHHGLSALQRPVGSSSLQAPPPGSSHPMQFPGHASAQLRPFGPGNVPHLGQTLNPLPEHLLRPSYKQPHGPKVSPGIAGPGSTSNFGRGQAHYESEMFLNQRPNYDDGRRLDPLGQQLGKQSSAAKMNGAPGLDSSLGFGLRDETWRPLPEEHMNPFPQNPARQIFEGEEFEDLKHFPRTSDLDNDSVRKYGSRFPLSRPLDKGAHGFGPEKLEVLGGPPSRFFPPYQHDASIHPGEIGGRAIGFHERIAGGQPDHSRNRDFRYDMAPKSPRRDHTSHGFGALPGIDDFNGRESHRFGGSFHGSRFPVLRSHLHRGEFDGSIQDGFSSYFHRVDHFGPNLPGHLGEPIGLDGFHGSARIGELPGPGNIFNPLLGEPGYRSNFSLKGYHDDSQNYTGDFESFDNSRRRKTSSIGWCRICKLDCETVEGLDLHSQTRDHQKKAMDMVLTIKQNAKKQKLASTDRSSLDDVSKSRNSSFEGGQNKK